MEGRVSSLHDKVASGPWRAIRSSKRRIMDNGGIKNKPKVKGRHHTCNVVSVILDPNNGAQLTNSEIETGALVVKHEAVPLVGTRSGRQHLKDFENVDVGPFKSSEEANVRPTK